MLLGKIFASHSLSQSQTCHNSRVFCRQMCLHKNSEFTKNVFFQVYEPVDLASHTLFVEKGNILHLQKEEGWRPMIMITESMICCCCL